MRLVFHIRVTGLLYVLKDEGDLKVPPTCSKNVIKELHTGPQMNERMKVPNYCAIMTGPRGALSPKEETR